MPRRKYGRLTKAVPPTPPEKCRQCKHGRRCPIHTKKEYDEALRKKEARNRAKRMKRGH